MPRALANLAAFPGKKKVKGREGAFSGRAFPRVASPASQEKQETHSLITRGRRRRANGDEYAYVPVSGVAVIKTNGDQAKGVWFFGGEGGATFEKAAVESC